jgi:hypothetical protein
MQAQWSNRAPYYRCCYPAEHALTNDVDHPKTTHVRPDEIVPALDHWLSTVFDPANIDDTCALLSAANEADRPTASRAQEAAAAKLTQCYKHDRRVVTVEARQPAHVHNERVGGASWTVRRRRYFTRFSTLHEDRVEHQLKSGTAFAARASTCRMSVDGARGNDPFAWLPGDCRDPVEVRVVMKHRQSVRLRRRGDEEVRQLSAALMLGGEHALHLPRALNMIGRRLDEVKYRQRTLEPIPLGRAPSRVTDLKIADPGAGEFAHIRAGFDLFAYRSETQPRQHARVDEMAQRHASSR